jgi:hypothetical protein
VRCAGNVHATKPTQEKNEETRKKKVTLTECLVCFTT